MKMPDFRVFIFCFFMLNLMDTLTTFICQGLGGYEVNIYQATLIDAYGLSVWALIKIFVFPLFYFLALYIWVKSIKSTIKVVILLIFVYTNYIFLVLVIMNNLIVMGQLLNLN